MIKKLEMTISNRYWIKITDNDWKDVENVIINELESNLTIKINSQQELIDV